MRHFIYIIICALVWSFASCSSDKLEEDGSTTMPNHQDEDTLSAALITDDYQYKLPVIFHVLYQDRNDQSQYIPSSRFRALLGYVNNIYQGGVYEAIDDDRSSDVRLTFELAEQDEQGNKLSTPGVDYVKWNGDYPIDVQSFMSGKIAEAKSLIWEPNDYINVMVFPFKNDDSGGLTLGISHLPFAVEGDSALAGLTTVKPGNYTKHSLTYPHCSSINGTYVWKVPGSNEYYESSRYADPTASSFTVNAADIVVTLAHELGHYLGLFHAYTEQNDSTGSVMVDDCFDSDYCDDTFSYDRMAYEKWLTDYMTNTPNEAISLSTMLSRTDCDGNDQFSTDIMDYAWSLGYKITEGQRSRIRQVLYYSPLIPGPKKASTATTKAASSLKDQILSRPRFVKCTFPIIGKADTLTLKP